jgi:hypothetical protein
MYRCALVIVEIRKRLAFIFYGGELSTSAIGVPHQKVGTPASQSREFQLTHESIPTTTNMDAEHFTSHNRNFPKKKCGR